jgi:anti-sigma regulatory factor (Ser/Thr protein kinase)
MSKTPLGPEERVILRNDSSELLHLSHAVATFCAACHLGEGMAYRASLALEEVVCNIISYAYSDAAEHLIEIAMAVRGDELVLQVSDDGRPFNPLHATPPNLDIPLQQRSVGGLGIHLVRQFMDEVAYERVAGHNVLTMRAVLETDQGAEGPASSI